MRKVFVAAAAAAVITGCDSLESQVRPLVYEDAEISGLREGRDGAICGEARRPGKLWVRLVVVDGVAYYALDVLSSDLPGAQLYVKHCL